MEIPIKSATCKVIAPQTAKLPDLTCECCGKPLKRQAGNKTMLLYSIVECQGHDYKVCYDCEKVIKWICKKQKESEKDG